MTSGSVIEDVLPQHAVPRAALVARLVELDAQDAFSAAHVRAGAQVAGVHQRTVWRWLGHARTHGAVDRLPRRRFEIDEPGWDVLAQAGGNVAVLYRHLTDTAADPEAVPSLSTLHRVVRRDREAGRELPSRRVLARVREDERARDALADLALDLPGTNPPVLATPASFADTPHAAPRPSRGPGPARTRIATDARPSSPAPALPPTAVVVPTTAIAAVAAAIDSTLATAGIACVYGNTGRGKTVAVHTVLAATPHADATWVRAPLYPTVAEFRRALFEALAVPGRFPHRSSSADTALITALAASPARRLVVVDETQRLPRPCLEFLQQLWDHPGARFGLVLIGTGGERAVRRVPQLASRVGIWQEIPRLPPDEVPATMRAFHPVWAAVPSADLAWIDEQAARGTFRIWATLTTHLHTTRRADPTTAVDRTTLRPLLRRLGTTT